MLQNVNLFYVIVNVKFHQKENADESVNTETFT